MLKKGEVFTGIVEMNGAEKWIKLTSINGVPVATSRYVAAWVVNITSEYPDPDTAPNSPSDLVRAIFVEEDGTEVHYALTKIEAS